MLLMFGKEPGKKPVHVLGLMSGTSCDGVDIAWLETDGDNIAVDRGFFYKPYPPEMKTAIRALFGRRDRNAPDCLSVEQALTAWQAAAVSDALAHFGLTPRDVALIGFHGQTITHDPAARLTIQLGDGALMARATGIDTVYDFRSADMAAGGQGAPLIPFYHRALVAASARPLPVAVLNIGGVANVTWVGGTGDDGLLAFDTGPGNALIDDFMRLRGAGDYDDGGRAAASGAVHHDMVAQWLKNPYFEARPPKSLDRGSYGQAQGGAGRDVAVWDVSACDALTVSDGAATLTELTAQAIAQACRHFPALPRQWVVCGGGRHNTTLMARLRDLLAVPVRACDDDGWNGDGIEAQGFAYLAVRARCGRPLSGPTTTGAPQAMTGGRFAKGRAS